MHFLFNQNYIAFRVEYIILHYYYAIKYTCPQKEVVVAAAVS